MIKLLSAATYPHPSFVRVRYVAADSSLITETYSVFGWVKLPILIPDSTTYSWKYDLTSNNYNTIIAIYGDNNSYFIKKPNY